MGFQRVPKCDCVNQAREKNAHLKVKKCSAKMCNFSTQGHFWYPNVLVEFKRSGIQRCHPHTHKLVPNPTSHLTEKPGAKTAAEKPDQTRKKNYTSAYLLPLCGTPMALLCVLVTQALVTPQLLLRRFARLLLAPRLPLAVFPF